jgi:hypothetical protein
VDAWNSASVLGENGANSTMGSPRSDDAERNTLEVDTGLTRDDQIRLDTAETMESAIVATVSGGKRRIRWQSPSALRPRLVQTTLARAACSSGSRAPA